MSAILQRGSNYVQSQSHRVYPENWGGEGWVAVPTEFEAIAIANSPYLNVEYADDGETIANITTYTPKPNVEVIRDKKIKEISAACNTIIDAGTSVDLPSGTREAFTYTLEDQANVSEMFTACLAGATGYIYHANNGSCKTYPAADVFAIYGTLSMYKTGQLTYHNKLRDFVNSLTTAEDIQTVTYGQPLIGEYLTQYNDLMAEAQTQMDAVLAKISQGMSL